MDVQPITVVDAFTSVPFAGNPAAVCVLEQEDSAEWMQSVAKEMNLSETAFLVSEGENVFRLRWFTPKVEVKLCGHATLASAHVLWEEGQATNSKPLHFETLSGRLTAEQKEEGWIALNFPSQFVTESDCPPELRQGLGAELLLVAKYDSGFLVEVANKKLLLGIEPDFSLLVQGGCGRVIVTCKAESGDEYDFFSRFFAPDAGINEDPVTGSAHCVLAPYWAKKLGRNELHAFQCSERGGELRLSFQGARTVLQGRAVTMLKGQLLAR
ncbi:MAG: PhzF family phenazine biosynthesis protein [Verrucomicrobia bacterium]|nr:PhzF family phenazine biosynthesis protein [Verrucomicrobiota bacterium]